MRIFDALAAARPSRPKSTSSLKLSTPWSEQIDPGNILPEYPRPQLEREEWISLNGPWDYCFTEKKSRPEKPDGQILVPFSPECSRSGVGRALKPREFLWYSRFVSISSIPEGKRLLLHFGAVDQRCCVWWNDRYLGKHQNGYLPFSFDVTDFLKEGPNTLRVRVQDDTEKSREPRGKQSSRPKGMFYTAQSGIWQTVWMEWVPENHIEDLKITPLFDKARVQVNLTLTHAADLEFQMTVAGDTYFHCMTREDFPEGENTLSCEFDMPGFHAWTPDDPYLYEFQITAGEDRVRSYFAMRKFSAGPDEKGVFRLFLNNQPMFFNGILDQGYWPESLYTAPSDEAMIFDIETAKSLGFNMIRKHLKLEPLRWYYHCDRLGMVVWQDMVNGGGRPFMPLLCYLPTLLPFFSSHLKDSHYLLFSRLSAKKRSRWEEDCLETVSHLYNVPSIGLWTLFNEGWGQFDSLRIASRVRKADSTRLIDHASGWFDQGGGDIKSVHNYFHPLKVQKGRRPFVLTEYGGGTCPVKNHVSSPNLSFGYHSYHTTAELTEALRKLQRQIDRLKIQGLAGAVYTQLSDIESETNGLLTYDRRVLKVEDSELSL